LEHGDVGLYPPWAWASILHEDWGPKCEGRRAETRGPEGPREGVKFLMRSNQPRPHQLEGPKLNLVHFIVTRRMAIAN